MMLPVKRIVCPSDFSDPSFRALTVANELALHFDADLFVLHVVFTIPPLYYSAPAFPDGYVGIDVMRYQKDLIDEAHSRMESIVSEKISQGVKVHKVVIQGDAAYQIVEYSKEASADLIVISTHGLTGWKLIAFGSVADKVVKLAGCPVLTVHREDAS
jgi:nucleotide-binding universal stress UspA family protein